MLKKIIDRIKTIILETTVYIVHVASRIPSHHIRRLIYRLAGVKIGKGSTIHMYARFYNPANIRIGADSIIGESVVLDGRGKLTIGDHVALASEVMIYNSKHDIEHDDFAAITEPVKIDDYVFIGPRAIILPGVKVGRGAIVAAGAVVTKSVPPFAIVGGVPSKIIGERRNKSLTYRLGRAAWFR